MAAPGPARSALQPIDSFDAWRAAARDLLARGIPPHEVQWPSLTQEHDLFAGAEPAAAVAAPEPVTAQAAPPAMRLPRKLMDMLTSAACHRAPDRWAFLYRVVWRWMHGQHEVISAADEDGSRLHGMVKAVRHEEHDMHAYLRFRERPMPDGAPRDRAPPDGSPNQASPEEAPRFVAWFEPAHDVLPRVAQHFADRMGGVSWLICTPDASVLWDGATLHFAGPLMRGAADIDDAGEALWLTYYRSIFNPARLNTSVMHSHIPARFWKNLPEGSQVPDMVASAANGARRVGQTGSVGERDGSVIAMTPERAQPQRSAPSSLDQCRRCDLWKNATQAVTGSGPVQARIMLIGEQPGDQEDLAGLPFVGPAGQVLDRALTEAGFDRKTVYLTNAVKHFKWEPRGKRRLHKTPAQREVEACHFWLEEELARVQPEVLVALGGTALKSITGDPHIGLTENLGLPFRHKGRWVVAIYHPSYVLRVPDERLKREAMALMVAGLKEAQRLIERGNAGLGNAEGDGSLAGDEPAAPA